MKAWYFAAANRRLRHGDNRLVRESATHTVEGDLELCGHGLHASERITDALGYAPGPLVCRVELGGAILRGGDKVCASSRTYLRVLPRAKSEAVLREFARKAALRVVHLWNAPPVVVKWLKTGNPSLRAQAYIAARANAKGEVEAIDGGARLMKLQQMSARSVIWVAEHLHGPLVKAAVRLRKEGSYTRKLALHIRFQEDFHWEKDMKVDETQVRSHG